MRRDKELNPLRVWTKSTDQVPLHGWVKSDTLLALRVEAVRRGLKVSALLEEILRKALV